jgi:hypothetical protein
MISQTIRCNTLPECCVVLNVMCVCGYFNECSSNSIVFDAVFETVLGNVTVEAKHSTI